MIVPAEPAAARGAEACRRAAQLRQEAERRGLAELESVPPADLASAAGRLEQDARAHGYLLIAQRAHDLEKRLRPRPKASAAGAFF